MPPLTLPSELEAKQLTQEVESEIKECPIPAIDISNKTFELHTAVFLDKEMVKNTMDTIKLQTFKFQESIIETIKEVIWISNNTEETIKWIWT